MKRKLLFLFVVLICILQVSLSGFAASGVVPMEFTSENLAINAKPCASSVDDTNSAYSIQTLNDGIANAGFDPSWSSSQEQVLSDGNVWAGLEWSSAKEINTLKLYMVQGYELKDYDIQIEQDNGWITVQPIRGNTQSAPKHTFNKTYTTSKIRILCLSGSDNQPYIARLTEIEVFRQTRIEEVNKDGRIVRETAEHLNVGKDELVDDVDLPTDADGGYTKIKWISSDPSTITDNGKITRDDDKIKTAVLTAILTRGDIVFNKDFNITVWPEQTPIETVTTEKWRAAELELESRAEYEYPYLDVDTEVTFCSPSGTIIKRKAFYDGANIWRVRFAPTEEGEWTYTTVCSNRMDAGLHRRSGKVICKPYEGDLDIYKHGFVWQEEGKRYLTYADGTPFLYVADCGWMSLSSRVSLYETNAPSKGTSMFQTMIDTRVNQGYNGYRMNFFVGAGDDVYWDGNRNEGGYPWTKGRIYTPQSSSAMREDYGEGSMHTGPERAFDGIEDNYWRASDNTYPQWLQIDFRGRKTVNGVNITFVRDDIWKFDIEVSEDGTNYTKVYSTPQNGFRGKVFKYDFSRNTETRFIRLVINDSESKSFAGVCEMTPLNSIGEELTLAHYFRDLNPEFFKNADERIQYIVNNGLMADLGLDWGRHLMPGMEKEFKRFADYINARYGAYPVMWHTAGEAGTGHLQSWIEIAKYMKQIDSYNHVNTIHNDISNPDYKYYSDNLDWHDVNYTQFGHEIYTEDLKWWNSIYNREPVKPFIEGEALFENIHGLPSYITREAYWKAVMAGSAGFVYSAEGLWQATYDENDTWQVWGENPVPWYIAIDKEAGKQLPYLKKFFENLDWWELIPDENAVIWENAPTGTQHPYQKRNQDYSVLTVYIPSHELAYNGTAKLKSNSEFTAKWYNTRTGEYIIIDDKVSSGPSGVWAIPDTPDCNTDWALELIQNN